MSRFLHSHRDRRHALVWLLTLAVMLTVLGAGPSHAQSMSAQTEAERQAGDPYFHEAAQYYVAEQKQPALQAIEEGLAVAPNHPKLLALRSKIREQQSAQPQPSDQGAERDNPQSGQQDNPDGAESSQGQGEQQEGDTPQENDGATPPTPGSAGEPGEQDAGPSDPPPTEGAGQQGEQPQQSEGGAAESGRRDGRTGEQTDRLSRAQAERILQALEGQEKQLLREVQQREARPRRVEKDW